VLSATYLSDMVKQGDAWKIVRHALVNRGSERKKIH
jgi:hypothetical protein